MKIRITVTAAVRGVLRSSELGLTMRKIIAEITLITGAPVKHNTVAVALANLEPAGHVQVIRGRRPILYRRTATT